MTRTWLYTLMMLVALIVLESTKPASAMDHFYSVLYTMPHGHAVPRMPQYVPPPPPEPEPEKFTLSPDGSYKGPKPPFALRASSDIAQDCKIYPCSGAINCVCVAEKTPTEGIVPLAQNAVISDNK